MGLCSRWSSRACGFAAIVLISYACSDESGDKAGDSGAGGDESSGGVGGESEGSGADGGTPTSSANGGSRGEGGIDASGGNGASGVGAAGSDGGAGGYAPSDGGSLATSGGEAGAGSAGEGGSAGDSSTSSGGEAGSGGAPAADGGAGGAGGETGVGGQGGLGSIGGEGGAPSGPESNPVTPSESSGTYTFSYGDIVFEVDADVGGRVMKFSKGGTNVIDLSDLTNFGSSFWPSPQSAWGWWPPPAEIDNLAYLAALDGASLVLSGSTNAELNLSCKKRFTVDAGFDRVSIEYSLKNESGSASVSVAPWEVTRVDVDGLAFFPAPATPIQVNNNFPYTYDSTNHITWFDYTNSSPQAGAKLFSDGSGWLAQAKGGLLFLKSFPDVGSGSFASGESEVEIYTNASSYVELENQGAYVTLAPGTSLTYAVTWYLRAIPGGVTVASGSPSLFAFASGVASD